MTQQNAQTLTLPQLRAQLDLLLWNASSNRPTCPGDQIDRDQLQALIDRWAELSPTCPDYYAPVIEDRLAQLRSLVGDAQSNQSNGCRVYPHSENGSLYWEIWESGPVNPTFRGSIEPQQGEIFTLEDSSGLPMLRGTWSEIESTATTATWWMAE